MRLTPSQNDALNIEKHVCVTAGAGAGKTTVLVERYLKILREGNVTPREIVAITFTEKAAAEMKERIIEGLSGEARGQSNSLQRFREEMSTAPISTIHAFCSRILREFPFQAKVPANFSILQGIDQTLLLQQTAQKTLKDIATNADEEHRYKLTRLLHRYRSRQNLANLLFTMVDGRETIENQKQEIYNHQSNTEIRETWEQCIATELVVVGNQDEWIRCLNVVLEIARGPNAEEVRELTNQLAADRESGTAASARLRILAKIAVLITTAAGNIARMRFLGRSVDIIGLEAEIDFLVSATKKIRAIPPLNEDDSFLIDTTRDLLILYERIQKAYQREKLSQGKLDYTDLQLETRALLQSNEEIRQKLIARYQYYMIDEYQDTNRLQSELVMLLTNELQSANLFIVGDPKQSIYGFRGADVRVFEKTRQQIIRNGGLDISLTENFRALRDVLGFINCFFDRLMGEESENEFEVPYECLIKARPVDAAGAVEILLGKQEDKPVNESALIANRIKSLKAKGTKYGDIAILIRSRTYLPDIERALLEEGIPYLTIGGIGFYQRQEIYDIWNYLKFLDAPAESEVSLAAILRGPCFAVSDTELYEISQQQCENFWDKVQKYLEHTATASDALKIAIACLKKHCQIARRLPINQLILTIVNETGMIGTLKTGKQGAQRWANYQKLLDLARSRDSEITPTEDVRHPESGQTLASFIKFLEVLIEEEPREGQAPIERSESAVNIMTIHAAKGLEFPVVILPCLERGAQTDREPFIDELLGIGFSPLNPDDGYVKSEPSIVKFMKSRAKGKAEAEKKRLFYVGATRAADRLILSGTRNRTAINFLKWLYEHLDIAEQDALRLPVRLAVLCRDSEIAPTNNSPSSESFELSIPIIRKPEVITSGDEVSDESPQVEIPEHPDPALTPQPIGAHFSVTELSNYARCPMRYQLQNVLRFPPISALATDSDPLVDAESVISETDGTDWDGTERGRAVHDILRQIRWQDDRERLDTLICRASQDYRLSANTLRTEVTNFLDSELGKTALSASKTYTERLIRAELGKYIVAGGIDRIFKDETGLWQVIDYKTDQLRSDELTDRVAYYRPQMELYGWLVHKCYPDPSTVIVNLFFTALKRCEPLHFSAAELQKHANQWQEKMMALQQGIYEKDLTHCCFCPYADDEQQCIVSDLDTP